MLSAHLTLPTAIAAYGTQVGRQKDALHYTELGIFPSFLRTAKV